VGPMVLATHRGRPDSVGDISPHSARKTAAKYAQMHGVRSSLIRDLSGLTAFDRWRLRPNLLWKLSWSSMSVWAP
jgi:hypothetical protein